MLDSYFGLTSVWTIWQYCLYLGVFFLNADLILSMIKLFLNF